MFRALVVLAALSFAVVSSHENPDCDVEPEHRVDAWDGEFDLHGCEERGFCWNESPSHNPGPSCFHHAEVEGHASEGECDAARQQERRDCLPGGGDAHDCGASRACSSPRPRAPPPLARHRPPPRARPPHTHFAVNKGCCWTPSANNEDPYCYYTVGSGEQAEL